MLHFFRGHPRTFWVLQFFAKSYTQVKPPVFALANHQSHSVPLHLPPPCSTPEKPDLHFPHPHPLKGRWGGGAVQDCGHPHLPPLSTPTFEGGDIPFARGIILVCKSHLNSFARASCGTFPVTTTGLSRPFASLMESVFNHPWLIHSFTIRLT